MDRDTSSTIAGGLAGMSMLCSVRWELVGLAPWGETVKVAVALTLALAGFLMYRGKGTPAA